MSYGPFGLNLAVANDPNHVMHPGGCETAAAFSQPGELPDNVHTTHPGL